MLVQPVSDGNLDQAVNLLKEGFPNRSESFWRKAIGRIHRSGGNKKAEVPVGYLMGSEKNPSGVVLTPAKPTDAVDGAKKRLINLSSWYVREHDRWRAPMMMRQILRLDNAVFTDLTPTESVQEMLKAFGFNGINAGVAVSLLPFSRLKSAGNARIVPLSECKSDTLESDFQRELAMYQDFDCLVAMLLCGSGGAPLVFKKVRHRKVPLAMLVYSGDNETVYRNLPAIAKYLAKEGIHLLVVDIPPDRRIPGIARPERGKKFALGMAANNRTDFLGTELSLFDW